MGDLTIKADINELKNTKINMTNSLSSMNEATKLAKDAAGMVDEEVGGILIRTEYMLNTFTNQNTAYLNEGIKIIDSAMTLFQAMDDTLRKEAEQKGGIDIPITSNGKSISVNSTQVNATKESYASQSSANRINSIMEKYKAQSSSTMWNGYYKNNPSGEINCRWLTGQKINSLLGYLPENNRFSMTGRNGEVVTGAGGIQYRITEYSAQKPSDLIAQLEKKQPVSNIVLNFTKDSNHAMMIDRIVDGKVYFTDNSQKSWDAYKKTGTYPVSCMTLKEFGTYYDKYNGRLAAAYSLDQIA